MKRPRGGFLALTALPSLVFAGAEMIGDNNNGTCTICGEHVRPAVIPMPSPELEARRLQEFRALGESAAVHFREKHQHEFAHAVGLATSFSHSLPTLLLQLPEGSGVPAAREQIRAFMVASLAATSEAAAGDGSTEPVVNGESE